MGAFETCYTADKGNARLVDMSFRQPRVRRPRVKAQLCLFSFRMSEWCCRYKAERYMQTVFAVSAATLAVPVAFHLQRTSEASSLDPNAPGMSTISIMIQMHPGWDQVLARYTVAISCLLCKSMYNLASVMSRDLCNAPNKKRLRT